jgi:hypothetical protein
VRGPLKTLIAWWRGDVTLADARSAGMIIEGRRDWVGAFPKWFERYAFAAIPAARPDEVSLQVVRSNRRAQS